MKKLLFKFILWMFEDRLIDYFLEEQMPIYKMDKDNTATLEKLADLYIMDEFRLFMKLQSNKRNFLAQKALTLKYKNSDSAAIQLAFLKGQAYDVVHTLRTIKYFNKLYQKKRSTNERGEKEDSGK